MIRLLYRKWDDRKDIEVARAERKISQSDPSILPFYCLSSPPMLWVHVYVWFTFFFSFSCRLHFTYH